MPSEARHFEVYSRLPAFECKGLCQEFCGPVPVSTRERQRIQRAAGVRVIDDREARCPYLGDEGECTVHAIRPFMCRVWGMAEGMICPYGCEPSRPLSRRETLAMARELGIRNDRLLAELEGDAVAAYEEKLARQRAARRSQ